MSKHYYSIQDFLGDHEVKPGRALVVGSKCYGEKPDRRKYYENAIGIDLYEGSGVDYQHDLETPLPEDLGRFDHIDCCSVLEHVRNPWKLCQNIEAVMNPGATILVMAPFVWRVHDYPGDYWRITAEALEVLFPSVRWETRGYLMEDMFSKIVKRIEIKGKRFLQRSEVVGFGCIAS